MKRVVLLDAFAVTNGYVIRVAAGAVTIDVTPSPWLYATTVAAAALAPRLVRRNYKAVQIGLLHKRVGKCGAELNLHPL